MNQKRGILPVRDACRKGTLRRMLEKYLQLCHQSTNDTVTQGVSKRSVPKLGTSLPNLGGFCRFAHVGTEELLSLSEEFPEEVDRLLAILEDEALNSSLPPALLSIYLKKRLGYDRDEDRGEQENVGLNIRFEHDIFRDGE